MKFKDFEVCNYIRIYSKAKFRYAVFYMVKSNFRSSRKIIFSYLKPSYWNDRLLFGFFKKVSVVLDLLFIVYFL